MRKLPFLLFILRGMNCSPFLSLAKPLAPNLNFYTHFSYFFALLLEKKRCIGLTFSHRHRFYHALDKAISSAVS